MTQKSNNPIEQPDETIDRDSYEPAYAQLVNILHNSMALGIHRPGDKLPSETQLCKRYGVSPMTVRRAINTLVNQGFVIAEQGRGTFVKPIAMGQATFKLKKLEDIFNDTEHTTVKIIETSILKADERVARKLAIPVGQRTIFIRRILQSDGSPTIYHREYLIYDPNRPIVETELGVTALQGLFNGTGETIFKCGDISLEATILNDEESKLLQASHPIAAFCFEHLFYDFDDKPISWGWFIVRADFLRFSTHVGLLRYRED